MSASRKLGDDTARELILGADTVFVSKGKKLDTFKGGKADDKIVAAMLGTTGNLRAPTIKKGPFLLVGFNEELYRKVLG